MIIGKTDKTAFKLFVKALFNFLRDKEGMIVELENKLYIVHKGRSEEGEMLLKITEDLDEIPECYKRDGQLLWIGKELPKSGENNATKRN